MTELKHTIIIAEAGVNHNGDITLAKKLIDIAAESGADYVKFQTFKADKLVTRFAEKAAYQRESGSDDSQLNMLKRLELTPDMHYELIEYCKQRNINFLSTAFDTGSLDFLHSLGLRLAKIPSGEITNLPYLKKAASLYPQIILSTGMADINEIRDALKVLLDAGSKKEHITILHCNTEYPTPMEDVNLKAMLHIQQELGIRIGYSDHTLGIEVPVAAVALGAVVIEKHFTVSRGLEGPDHQASLEPGELKAMVAAIRNIEKAIAGEGIKRPSNSEAKNKEVVRKSIHLAHAMQQGETLSEKDITALRPGNGISPMEWDKITGRKILKDLPEGYQLSWSDIE